MPEFVWELPPVRPAATSTETVTSDGTIDHAQAAINRLPSKFRKPKIEALLRILCAPMAALEQAFVDLLLNRTLDTAEGEQLNVLGRIVGQKPADVTETTYRSLIRARIKANKSSGLGDQILIVSRLVLSDYAAQDDVVAAGALALELLPEYPASYSLRINNMDVPWDLADLLMTSFLQEITGTGIGVRLEFTPQEDPSLSAYEDDLVLGSSIGLNATAEFVGKFTVQATEEGAAGNGILVEVIQAGPGNPGALTVDDPDHVVVRFNVTPMDMTPDTSWEDLYVLLNTSSYIQVVSTIATGTMVAGDAESVTTSGALEDATEGLRLGDLVIYPRTLAEVDDILGAGTMQHLHLCDNVSPGDIATEGGLDLAEGLTPTYEQEGLTDGDLGFGVGSTGTGFFTVPSPNLQADATKDFVFACVFESFSDDGTRILYPFRCTDGGFVDHQSVIFDAGQFYFNIFDGVNAAITAGLTIPTVPFALMVVLERATNQIVAAICEIGGTVVASAPVDVSTVGDLTTGLNAFIGRGTTDTQSVMTFWMASCDVASGTGLVAGISTALQAFVDSIDDSMGGTLRAAME